MAIYYVDLGVTSNPGYLANDVNNPMGWNEFISGPGSSTYYLKGSKLATGVTLGFNTSNLLPWGTDPWRIKCATFGMGITGSVRIEGGILDVTDFNTSTSPAIITIANMFIRASNQFFLNRFLSWIRTEILGSTIVTPTFKFHAYDGHGSNEIGLRIRDSVIDTSSIVAVQEPGYTMNVSLENSAFKINPVLPSYCTIVANQNNQTDLISPTWPNWDAGKASWASKTLGSGITAEPTMSFTGYPNGMFGSPRKGVGSFYFPLPVSTLSAGTTINIATVRNAQSVLDSGTIESMPSVVANPVFNNSAKWESVLVVYEHSSGQNRRIYHKLVNDEWVGNIDFPIECQAGAWEKTKIIITDRVGAILTINRDEIGQFEDLTLTA